MPNKKVIEKTNNSKKEPAKLSAKDFKFIGNDFSSEKNDLSGRYPCWWWTWSVGDSVKTPRGIDFYSTYDDVIATYGSSEKVKFDKKTDDFVANVHETLGEDYDGDMGKLKTGDFYCQYIYEDKEHKQFLIRFYFGKDNKLKVIATAYDSMLFFKYLIKR